jgi:hypothetical protein
MEKSLAEFAGNSEEYLARLGPVVASLDQCRSRLPMLGSEARKSSQWPTAEAR